MSCDDSFLPPKRREEGTVTHISYCTADHRALNHRAGAQFSTSLLKHRDNTTSVEPEAAAQAEDKREIHPIIPEFNVLFHVSESGSKCTRWWRLPPGYLGLIYGYWEEVEMLHLSIDKIWTHLNTQVYSWPVSISPGSELLTVCISLAFYGLAHTSATPPAGLGFIDSKDLCLIHIDH